MEKNKEEKTVSAYCYECDTAGKHVETNDGKKIVIKCLNCKKRKTVAVYRTAE